ncbi:integrase catalytic domain-containing protein [Nephila pilipes]|uniref:Integrase catalytic domain-containing protein n=1 Tax=Nephila pilipes TaxID=299642 RepID=A0A8X6U2C4_NEPPI|nr:integrase catalytic domain-containing protein [Nephila pilipes]
MRFKENARNPLQRTTGNLTVPELSAALICLVRSMQFVYFSKDIQCIMKREKLSNSSKLLNLSPFLDEKNVLWVSRRLQHSKLLLNHKHPMLIPSNCNICDLIIDHYHVFYLHTGVEATLANLRTQFWVTNGRFTVEKVLNKCLKCLKKLLDLTSGGNEFLEALQTSRRAKYVMEAAGMDLKKWITNDANLMEQWKKEKFDVYPVHETVNLGANETKVLGLSWNTHEDYLTTDTKSLLEFVSLDKNTKRFTLQAVGKIFNPLGLISPFTVRMKCLLQDLWREEIQWDDPLPTHIEKEWKKWCEELPHLGSLKIPRLVLDSTLLEDDVELHSFCDARKKAYGAAI